MQRKLTKKKIQNKRWKLLSGVFCFFLRMILASKKQFIKFRLRRWSISLDTSVFFLSLLRQNQLSGFVSLDEQRIVDLLTVLPVTAALKQHRGHWHQRQWLAADGRNGLNSCFQVFTSTWILINNSRALDQASWEASSLAPPPSWVHLEPGDGTKTHGPKRQVPALSFY